MHKQQNGRHRKRHQSKMATQILLQPQAIDKHGAKQTPVVDA